jgi:hypothetical protein
MASRQLTTTLFLAVVLVLTAAPIVLVWRAPQEVGEGLPELAALEIMRWWEGKVALAKRASFLPSLDEAPESPPVGDEAALEALYDRLLSDLYSNRVHALGFARVLLSISPAGSGDGASQRRIEFVGGRLSAQKDPGMEQDFEAQGHSAHELLIYEVVQPTSFEVADQGDDRLLLRTFHVHVEYYWSTSDLELALFTSLRDTLQSRAFELSADRQPAGELGASGHAKSAHLHVDGLVEAKRLAAGQDSKQVTSRPHGADSRVDEGGDPDPASRTGAGRDLGPEVDGDSGPVSEFDSPQELDTQEELGAQEKLGTQENLADGTDPPGDVPGLRAVPREIEHQEATDELIPLAPSDFLVLKSNGKIAPSWRVHVKVARSALWQLRSGRRALATALAASVLLLAGVGSRLIGFAYERQLIITAEHTASHIDPLIDRTSNVVLGLVSMPLPAEMRLALGRARSDLAAIGEGVAQIVVDGVSLPANLNVVVHGVTCVFAKNINTAKIRYCFNAYPLVEMGPREAAAYTTQVLRDALHCPGVLGFGSLEVLVKENKAVIRIGVVTDGGRGFSLPKNADQSSGKFDIRSCSPEGGVGFELSARLAVKSLLQVGEVPKCGAALVIAFDLFWREAVSKALLLGKIPIAGGSGLPRVADSMEAYVQQGAPGADGHPGFSAADGVGMFVVIRYGIDKVDEVTEAARRVLRSGRWSFVALVLRDWESDELRRLLMQNELDDRIYCVPKAFPLGIRIASGVTDHGVSESE